MKKAIIPILLFLSFSASSAQYGNSLWSDFKTSSSWLLKGSYLQFTRGRSLGYAAAGIPSTWYALENDDRLSHSIVKRGEKKLFSAISSGAILLNLPVLPLITYYAGKRFKSQKTIKFAMEYFATLYLANAETMILSQISIHERPETSDSTWIEDAFRGTSSFPSGHVIPYATLTFKTYEYYGFWAALLPATFTYMTAYQRVQDRKHYISDVIASFFIAGLASEGVRAAAEQDNNRTAYQKWLIKHRPRLGIVRYKESWGPHISIAL